MTLDFSSLASAQRTVSEAVDDAVRRERMRTQLTHDDLRAAAFSYLTRGGKRLRPLLVHLAAGAAGGDPGRVGSAALAVEVFHTWTLIHDDIIDKDTLRRGGPTVHTEFAQKRLASGTVDGARAREYGVAVAILAGDYLQGVAVRLVLDAARDGSVSRETVHEAATIMQTGLVRDLVEGEVRDVAFTHRPLDAVAEADLLDMYGQKSASLLGYCARVGAMLALDEPDGEAPLPATLAAFAEKSGIAFQIRDDVLGLVGAESRLGKPVGSDLREGKRTPIVVAAYAAAGEREREALDAVIGRADASDRDLTATVRLLDSLGGLEHARVRAEQLVNEAVHHLDPVPSSRFRDRLAEWARHLVAREA